MKNLLSWVFCNLWGFTGVSPGCLSFSHNSIIGSTISGALLAQEFLEYHWPVGVRNIRRIITRVSLAQKTFFCLFTHWRFMGHLDGMSSTPHSHEIQACGHMFSREIFFPHLELWLRKTSIPVIFCAKGRISPSDLFFCWGTIPSRVLAYVVVSVPGSWLSLHKC